MDMHCCIFLRQGKWTLRLHEHIFDTIDQSGMRNESNFCENILGMTDNVMGIC